MGDIKLFVRSVFVLLIFVFLISSPVFAFYDDDSSFAGNVFLDSLVFSSSNTTVDLVLDDVVLGHELLWRASTTGTNYEESAVAYVDGVAYIGSCSTHGEGYNMLFAVNTSDGEILWSKFTGPGYVGPVIDDDVIYIGTSAHGWDPGNQYMIAYNRNNGEELWRTKIYGGIAESVQYDNNHIYFAAGFDGSIYSLNKNDGSINWTFDTGLDVCANKPMLKDNSLYVALWKSSNFGGKLYKINSGNGEIIWEVTFSNGHGPWDNSITADNDGRIFLACYYGRIIYCFDEFDGSLIWEYDLHAGSLSFNAYHDGVVFISDTLGFVYALDAESGELIWENHVAGTFDISSPTVSGGLIFIGSRDFEDSAFLVLDELSGEVLWKYDLDFSVTAPPSIADGMMFCGTDGWYMYCFDFGVGDDDWLLHRYDSLNTAYSPGGLTDWQYVSAFCTGVDGVIVVNVSNFYDHSVFNVVLNLWDGFSGFWYDLSGNMVGSSSGSFMIDGLESGESRVFFVSEVPIAAPLKPVVPLGVDSGRAGVEYVFSSSCVDPDGDNLFYLWDWGDGNFSGWVGPFDSGDFCNVSYVWGGSGVFEVRVKARDVFGLEGVWSDPLSVSMPKNRLYAIEILRILSEKNLHLFNLLNALFNIR